MYDWTINIDEVSELRKLGAMSECLRADDGLEV